VRAKKPRFREIEAWCQRFGLPYPHHPSAGMPDRLTSQLCTCKSDEARRLILGISEQFELGQAPGEGALLD
jgi:hypothetical protein